MNPGSRPSRSSLALLLAVSGVCAVVTQGGRAADAVPAPPGSTPPTARSNDPFANDRARAAAENLRVRGQIHIATIPPRSPEQTVASFKLLPGLEAEVVLHEPDVRQPVWMSFDE